MIVFDLQCDRRHGFEAWFANSATFEDQRAAGYLCCPYCASTAIGKAVMAPRIAPRGAAVAPESILPKLAALQRKMLEGSTWVGSDFAGKARAISDGSNAAATIHGTATRDEARALSEDGVGVMPLLFPVVPPDKVN